MNEKRTLHTSCLYIRETRVPVARGSRGVRYPHNSAEIGLRTKNYRPTVGGIERICAKARHHGSTEALRKATHHSYIVHRPREGFFFFVVCDAGGSFGKLFAGQCNPVVTTDHFTRENETPTDRLKFICAPSSSMRSSRMRLFYYLLYYKKQSNMKKGKRYCLPPLCNIINPVDSINRRGQTTSLAALDPSSLHSRGHLLQPARGSYSFNVKKSIRRKALTNEPYPLDTAAHIAVFVPHTQTETKMFFLVVAGRLVAITRFLPTTCHTQTNRNKPGKRAQATINATTYWVPLQELRWTKVVSPHGIRPLFHPPRKTRTSQ